MRIRHDISIVNLEEPSRVPPEVREKLLIRKKAQEARGKDFKVIQPKQVAPRGLERQYEKELRDRIVFAEELVSQELFPRIEGLLREERQNLPTLDALSDDVFVIINSIKVKFAEVLKDDTLRELIRKVGLALSEHNLEQFRKVFKRAIGVDPFKSEPWLRSQVDNLIEQNVALIKSVEEKYFSEVQENVFRGARQGSSSELIAAEISKRGSVAVNRARLIARDQIGKFNGQLNQLRQQDVGVSEYRWRTSIDERVRSSHAEREGKTFSWNNPPSDGHPGEPINCRCYAEPVLEGLI